MPPLFYNTLVCTRSYFGNDHTRAEQVLIRSISSNNNAVMAIAKECSYLLMEDTHGEKAVGKFMSVLRGVPKLVPVLRGELLSSVSEAQEKTKYCLRKDPSITMHLDAYSVTPLDDSETHVQLLEAIEKPSDRFSVFAYKLEWGCKLRVGNQVNVRIPNENSSMPIWSLAVVKYVGEVKSLPGKNFGVEIKVQSVVVN